MLLQALFRGGEGEEAGGGGVGEEGILALIRVSD